MIKKVKPHVYKMTILTGINQQVASEGGFHIPIVHFLSYENSFPPLGFENGYQ